ncbi:MAG: hypothetical protein ACRDJ9_25425 [Dehalococcoidia bacterium]
MIALDSSKSERTRIVLAGATAALMSGLPSTAYALCTGGDSLAATRAAGTLVPLCGGQRGMLAGAVTHLAVSAGWTLVLSAVNRRCRLGMAGGLGAGALIATIDLEILGRRYPAIRALPRAPQWLDHLAFGVIVGAMLSRTSPRSPIEFACGH